MLKDNLHKCREEKQKLQKERDDYLQEKTKIVKDNLILKQKWDKLTILFSYLKAEKSSKKVSVKELVNQVNQFI
jgi:hypothetical protein